MFVKLIACLPTEIQDFKCEVCWQKKIVFSKETIEFSLKPFGLKQKLSQFLSHLRFLEERTLLSKQLWYAPEHKILFGLNGNKTCSRIKGIRECPDVVSAGHKMRVVHYAGKSNAVWNYTSDKSANKNCSNRMELTLLLFFKVFLINFDQSYEKNDSLKFSLLFESATTEFRTVWNLLFSVRKVLKFKVCLMFC